MDTFAERIRALRGNKTQDEFSKELDIHKNTLGRWERGQAEPDVSTASAICTRCGVSPYWLLSGQGPMYEKDREIKAVLGPDVKAKDLRGLMMSEVSGGPEYVANMASLVARLQQLEAERDEARAAEVRAKDEALKAKDEALQAFKSLAYRNSKPDADE